jgi:hypothetical protein
LPAFDEVTNMSRLLPPSIEAVLPALKQLRSDTDLSTVVLPTPALRTLLQLLLASWKFEEEWYVTTYSDVADGIRAGKFKSGREHYLTFGYFESRLPCQPNVDEVWYVKTFRDAKEGIAKGKFKNATEHFIAFGYREGRTPREQVEEGQQPPNPPTARRAK